MANYISLNEATKYCNYSADYLKLRARQGRLRAIKIGRNWATTPEWVEEYNNKTSAFASRASADKPTLKYYILGVAIVLIVVGVFINLDVFKEYYQWQVANVGEIFDKGLEIIPGKMIEVK